MPEPIEELFVSIGADISNLLDDTKKGVSEAERELKKAEKTGTNTFKRIGEFAKKATGIITAMSAAIVAVIASVIKLTRAAVENERAFANMAQSAAAANREFGRSVGTIDSWENSIKSLTKEMKVFSEREVTNATARLIDMTKRLGLTEDQMLEVLRRTGDLAAGKTDLIGAVERTTAALRGEAESAEFLGLSLNENSVIAYAEAHGILWKDLTDTQKAQQRYALFLEQTNQLQGRAADFAQTLAGAEAQRNAQLQTSSEILGEQLIPLLEGYNQLINILASGTDDSAGIVTKALAGISAAAITVGVVFTKWVDLMMAQFRVLSAGAQAALNWEDPVAATQEALANAAQEYQNYFNTLAGIPNITREAFDQTLKGFQDQAAARRDAARELAQQGGPGEGGSGFTPPPGLVQEESDELLEIVRDNAQELMDLQAEIDAGLIENRKQFNDTMAQIETEGAQERLEINEKFDKELADSQKDIIERAKEDLKRLEEESDREIAKRRKDANKEEARETEDHLTDMRRLRLSFLDNLEDAVKSRDAGRVRDLQRQFQRESQERGQDFQKKQSRERSDTQQEIAEVAANEDRRAQEIINRRTQALRDVEQRVRESRDRELMALDEKLAMEREKEQARFDERQAELDTAIDKRIESLTKELADMEGLQAESAQNILGILNETFGSDGAIEELMQDFANRRRQTMVVEIGFEQRVSEGRERRRTGGAAGGFGSNPGTIASFQHGGTLLATKPTLAQFGEVPELVQFTPLSKLGSMGGGQPQRIEIDFSGSAPPGIRSGDRDAIAGVVVNALKEVGVGARRGR